MSVLPHVSQLKAVKSSPIFYEYGEEFVTILTRGNYGSTSKKSAI